jgi:hypothetical protein
MLRYVLLGSGSNGNCCIIESNNTVIAIDFGLTMKEIKERADKVGYDLDEIKASFNKFGKLLPEDGFFIINGDDSNTSDILHDVKATVIKYGRDDSNDECGAGIWRTEIY